MTYEQAKRITRELRERFHAPYSRSDRDIIPRLYQEVLGKTFRKTNCQQCYHDAVIEIYLYLKNEKTMAKQSKYIMRAGFIIHSPLFHDGKIFTNINLTDDIAEEYMEMFPNKKTMFDLRPEPKTPLFDVSQDEKAETINDTSKTKKPRRTKKTKK